MTVDERTAAAVMVSLGWGTAIGLFLGWILWA